MQSLFKAALGLAAAATTFGATINLSTGTNNANWQVYSAGAGVFVTATSLTVAQQNGSWAPAPISISPLSGSNWISYGSIQGTACSAGQTPGNGCANANINVAGDVWTYTLNISAASLGATSGSLNYLFGADSRVNLFVGNNSFSQVWGGSAPTGAGFNTLGCSGTPVTNGGNTQAQYNNCVNTVNFGAGNLNGDGSLTLTAYVFNDPIVGSTFSVGNPTGFVLEGTVLTGAALTPEPATFGMVALVGLAGLVLRRKTSSSK